MEMDYWPNATLIAAALNHMADRVEATGYIALPTLQGFFEEPRVKPLGDRERRFAARLRRIAEQTLG